MIFVLLKNKLISCDTIIPFTLEIKEKVGTKAVFLIDDKKSYDEIKKNTFMYDSLKKSGELFYFPRSSVPVWGQLLRFFRASFYVIISIYCYLSKSSVIHFGQISTGFMAKIFEVNRKRIYFVQHASFGRTYEMDLAENTTGLTAKYAALPMGDNVIHFAKYWSMLNVEGIEKKKVFYFGATRRRQVWVDHVNKSADRYLESKVMSLPIGAEIGKKGYIVFMLSAFGKMSMLKDEHSMEKCFVETLEALNECCSDIPILLKPHIITNLDIVNKHLANFPKLKTNITYLHPNVLAKNATFFIANQYTNTLHDAVTMGVPTIEYAEYSDKTLAITKNQSQYPEAVNYFINRNKDLLKDTILAVLGKKKEVGQNYFINNLNVDHIINLFS